MKLFFVAILRGNTVSEIIDFLYVTKVVFEVWHQIALKQVDSTDEAVGDYDKRFLM